MTCPRCGCTIHRTWPSTATRCTTTPPPPSVPKHGTRGSGGKASTNRRLCTFVRHSLLPHTPRRVSSHIHARGVYCERSRCADVIRPFIAAALCRQGGGDRARGRRVDAPDCL